MIFRVRRMLETIRADGRPPRMGLASCHWASEVPSFQMAG